MVELSQEVSNMNKKISKAEKRKNLQELCEIAVQFSAALFCLSGAFFLIAGTIINIFR